MKTAIIRLDPHDDAISTRDHMAWHQAKRVLLVWPGRSQMFDSRLDLTLIHRHAEQLGVEIAMVAHTGRVKEYARELGIPVFRTVRAAQRSPWRRRRPTRRSLHWFTNEHQNVRAMKQDLEQESVAAMNGMPRVGIFSLGVLAVIALLVFFLPGATISFTPEVESQNLMLELRADSNLSAPTLSGGLPARSLIVVVEGQEQGEATGLSYSPLQTSHGSVVFTNLTDRPLTIPVGTVVRTTADAPVRFETTRSGTLRGEPGATLTLPIQARMAGKAGNVLAETIQVVEGAVGSSVSVINPNAITGGTDRSVRAPTEDDYRRLQESLLQSLETTALREFDSMLAPYDRLIPDTLRMVVVRDSIRDPVVGAAGERINLRLQVEFEAWSVSVQHIEAIANAGFHSMLPDGYQVVPDSFEIQSISPSGTASTGFPLQVQVERRVYPGWSEPVLVRSVLGSRIAEVSNRMNKIVPLAGEPVVQVTPAWWKRMPFLSFRIDLEAR